MISTFEKAIFLKEIEIFQTTSTEELFRIAETAEEVSFREGDFLFKEGTPADSFYIIVDGRVEFRRNQEAVSSIFKKTPAGVLAVLAGKPYAVTAVALTDIQALRFSAVDFMDFVSESDRVSREIIRALTVRLMDALGSQNQK